MTFTTTTLARKDLGSLARLAICRTYEDGTVRYGIASARKGDKSWTVTMTMFGREQVIRMVNRTILQHGALVYCG